MVFVQIKTPELIPSNGESAADASKEKQRMTQYLNQALIELHPDSQIVDLDLTAVAQFSNYVKNGKVNKVSK